MIRSVHTTVIPSGGGEVMLPEMSKILTVYAQDSALILAYSCPIVGSARVLERHVFLEVGHSPVVRNGSTEIIPALNVYDDSEYSYVSTAFFFGNSQGAVHVFHRNKVG